jgi:phenylpropionate dioxygenase-like ring-hydroxylating dioxygenase large terminal subunit
VRGAYPSGASQSHLKFLRESWYVAARAVEVTRQPLARTLLDEPVVLYRGEDGTAVALEDRCCHRHLPLSMGKLEGDRLRCGYHGLLFAPDGRCVEIPGQQRADAALIPNWWWAEHPEWAFTQPEQIYVRCNYQLIADNVLDVTHLAYVHSASIGASSITEFPATVEREERLVRLTRWIRDRPPPPLYKRAGGFAGNVERWQIVEHVPPCYSVNFAGCKDARHRIDLMALSAPTAETERTTHYFYGFVRNFGRADPAMEAIFTGDMVRVFHEDIPVLEAQQRMRELKPEAPSVDLKVDAAPLAARRMLQGLLERQE